MVQEHPFWSCFSLIYFCWVLNLGLTFSSPPLKMYVPIIYSKSLQILRVIHHLSGEQFLLVKKKKKMSFQAVSYIVTLDLIISSKFSLLRAGLVDKSLYWP